ncbi:MAG: 2-C-methyl-D-erythritol 4-phosphate cytidylyltransferase [Ruminococcaceae bacterium]|nr:2-C-methyl-D-erythritol 4-phosphate cytidylyltransferase [Oscillospiraceae bacterium]
MEISAKDIAGLLRTLSRTANQPHFTSAIIAAAGRGTRMCDESGTTKQMMELCGLPVIVRTLKAFEESALINEIIVVALAEEIEIYDRYRSEYGLTKISAIVPGGDTRQESVLCGFEAISDKSDFVAIHDGARCLITPEMIDKVLNEAFRKGAATAAVKASDTVKRADIKGFITETINRDELWLAQTPQIFKTEVYRAAAYVAKEEGFAATDDNMLAEHVGFQVKLVDCGTDNIKITTPADLAIAEVILRRRTK